jgi:hypothetical protein
MWKNIDVARERNEKDVGAHALPAEILEMIFLHVARSYQLQSKRHPSSENWLCMQTLLRCMQVNRSWEKAIRGSTKVMEYVYMLPSDAESMIIVDKYSINIHFEIQANINRRADQPGLEFPLWVKNGPYCLKESLSQSYAI